jgi:hypothetical protein
METSYTLDLEDFIALNLYLQHREDVKKGFSPTTYAVLMAVGALAAGGWGVYRIVSARWTGAIVWLVFSAGIAYAFIMFLKNRMTSMRVLRERLKTETADKIGKTSTARLTPTEFVHVYAGQTSSTPWQSIGDVGVTRDHLFVFSGDAVSIIPKRAFSADELFREFSEKAVQYCKAGKLNLPPTT